MPFKIVEEQKAFEWTLSGGLPVGECERWGKVIYCLCCPLCGMLHEIRGVPLDISGGEYQPRCIVKTTHKTVYAAWIAKQPQAVDYTRVWLKLRAPVVIPLGDVPAEKGRAA